jgi:hypothetical protein
MDHVWRVLTKLQVAGHYFKLSKFEFNRQRTSFLGFVMTLKGVKIEPYCVQKTAE